MSNKIDPSYLRYIHDGLNNSSIHPDNSSSLPDGLTGLYDSSFLGQLNVNDSQKLLTRFAFFSLLKKEVSCHFVAISLNEPEIEIKEFVATYSKWFNSAQVGKYTIYHERLKVYILSKLSENDFFTFNNRIIELVQDALAKNSHDEIVHYALEYLSSHLFIDAMITGNGESLKKIAYDNSHWNRQIEISKGVEWSKNMLNEMMLWASKYNEEEVIECALNKVDLKYKVNNDSKRIVELVAQENIEIALQRIDYFNTTNTSIGVKNIFILFYLILFEVANNKNQDDQVKKKNVDVILNKFDSIIPNDLKVFDFSNFFPVELILILTNNLLKIDNTILRFLQKSSHFISESDIDQTTLDDYFYIKDIKCKHPDDISISGNIFQASIDLAIKSTAFYKIKKIQEAKKIMLKAVESAENILIEYDGMGIPELLQQEAFLKIAVEMVYQNYNYLDIKNIILKSLDIKFNFSRKEKNRFIDDLNETKMSLRKSANVNTFKKPINLLVPRNRWVNSVNSCANLQELILLIKQKEKEVPLEYTFPSICDWIYKKHGYDNLFIFYRDIQKNLQVFNFTHIEIEKCRSYFYKGLIMVLKSEGFTKKNIINIIQVFYTKNNFSTLLKNYALFQIRNNKLQEREKDRLNKTFNIQWAIDIKNSFGED